jgi:hypothetical protein
MDTYDPADDDKCTIGIAASLCVMSLPVIYYATQPVILLFYEPWTPWFVISLYAVVPVVMAFNVLYCHPWYPKWSRPKRTILSLLLSCVIFGVDLLLIVFIILMAISLPGVIWGHEE